MSNTPDPVDIHVGARLRHMRSLAGISQEQLGKFSGITFQQVQKYEHGTNRLSASRLHQFSKILNVKVSDFFDGYDAEAQVEETKAIGIPNRRDVLELIRAYDGIESPDLRQSAYELVKNLARHSCLVEAQAPAAAINNVDWHTKTIGAA
jgi:transcriptional regulator with XRE-family HTH domain